MLPRARSGKPKASSAASRSSPSPPTRASGSRLQSRDQRKRFATIEPMDTTSLGEFDVMAFAPTTHASRAVEFYRDTLGLPLISQDGFAAAFDAHGIMLRVTSVPKPFTPQPFTVLGWKVPDIGATVKGLATKGVKFERYMDSQDELNIWTAPGGVKVAWFKDPDGNILSLTEF